MTSTGLRTWCSPQQHPIPLHPSHLEVSWGRWTRVHTTPRAWGVILETTLLGKPKGSRMEGLVCPMTAALPALPRVSAVLTYGELIYKKGAKNIHWGNKWYWENWTGCIQKNKTGPLSWTIFKNQLKMGQKPLDIWFGNDFLSMAPKEWATKEKNRQIRVNEH